MTIEEKLERLTDRHEALAQTLELMAHSTREQGEHIERVFAIVEKQTAHIEALFKFAESHERRLQRLEGETS